MIYLNIAVEDDLSEMVIRKLIDSFYNKFHIQNVYSDNGFGYLKSNILGFNEASKFYPFLVLTDLDRYDCPVELIEDWITFEKHKNLIFRISVREVEAWLLADSKGLATFFRISETNIPLNPETEEDPKNTIIKLAGKSRARRIREDITPIEGASIGPNYNGCLGEFVMNRWSVAAAAARSKSLKKAYDQLKKFQQI